MNALPPEMAGSPTAPGAGRRARIVAKMMERIAIDPATGCWLWTGPTSGDGRGGGYPRMNLDGATVAVHRVMWQIVHGPIAPHKQLDHVCRRRLCINPFDDHTEMVTHKANMRRRDEARRERAAMLCEAV